MRKKLIVLASAILVVAVSAVATSLAYFTDTKTVTNTFTVGNVEIKLDEAKVEKNEQTNKWVEVVPENRVTENTYDKIYPSAVLPKDPTVHNVGDYDAYVRAKVTINNYSAWTTAVSDFNLSKIADVDSTWELVGTATIDGVADTATYIYNYKNKLDTSENKDTTPIFAKITIPATLTNTQIVAITKDNMQINVVAEAIQADGFTDYKTALAELNTVVEAALFPVK